MKKFYMRLTDCSKIYHIILFVCAPYGVNLNNNTFQLKRYYALFIYVHNKREKKVISSFMAHCVHWHLLVAAKLYSLVTEVRLCEQLAKVVTWKWKRLELNPRSLDHKFNVLINTSPCHRYQSSSNNIYICTELQLKYKQQLPEVSTNMTQEQKTISRPFHTASKAREQHFQLFWSLDNKCKYYIINYQ